MHTFHLNDRSLIPAVYSSLIIVSHARMVPVHAMKQCVSQGLGLTSSVRGGAVFSRGEGVQFFQRGGGACLSKGSECMFVGGGGGEGCTFFRGKGMQVFQRRGVRS